MIVLWNILYLSIKLNLVFIGGDISLIAFTGLLFFLIIIKEYDLRCTLRIRNDSNEKNF